MRYTGPKGKINRRLGAIIYDNAGAVKAFDKRNYWPGMHAHRRRQISNYGFGLIEKKKICMYYGLSDRQFRRFFSISKQAKGNTGTNLLLICESRLDNVICRAGFTKTRCQSRQGVSHGHFLVNGRKTDICSYLVKVGDVIEVRNRENLKKYYKDLIDLFNREIPPFLNIDKDGQKITVVAAPAQSDISVQVDIEAVIEFVSR
jgi:small subunit ribosomal protein S4